MRPLVRRRPVLPRAASSWAPVVLLAVLAGLPAFSVSLPSATATGSASSASYCPSPGRAAKEISLASPTFPLASGDAMSVVYEFEVVNHTSSTINVTVTMPSTFAKFALTNGSQLVFDVTPRSIVLTGTNWSAASLATKTKTMTTAYSFASSPSAFLTTELLSVMANAARGSVELGIRWQWSVTFASNGSTVASPWSALTTNASSPTIFYPAPYVVLDSTTNRTVAIGSSFTATISGAISSTQFGSELEYASNGKVVRSNDTVSTGSPSSLPVSIQILARNAPLAPASMLDHIHDDCGSMLFILPLTVVYASNATVTIAVRPAGCGPVSFNGTSYKNGGAIATTPSSTNRSIAVGACSSHTFVGWSYTPGLYVGGSSTPTSTVVVSASGTLTARFV